MTAKYNVVARKNPRDPDAPPKYYPSVITTGRLTLVDLAERIATISTVSSIDTRAVLEALVQIVPEEIAKGNIVELGDFGSFRLRIKSEGSETPEEVNPTNITTVKPYFLPGKRVKQVLKNTEFQKA